MFPKEAISTLISELNGRIPPPVHTAGIEETRPVPAVIVDNIDLDNKNHHNSHYAGSEYSGGAEASQIFRYYYSLTIELTVRDDSEIGAYDILTQLVTALSNIARDPVNELHEDVHEVRVLGSGPISYQFIEPTETELNQTVVLESFYETTDSNIDVISSVSDDLTIS